MVISVIEVWKDVPGYEGLYLVSNFGRIKNTKSGRLKVPSSDEQWYLSVKLSKSGRGREYKVHRLVMYAFVGVMPAQVQVNHRDENRENNRLYNLEYCDANYNNNFGNRTAKANKTRSKRVVRISPDGSRKVFESLKDAGASIVSSSGRITDVAKHKYGCRTVHGYRFEYFETEASK